MKIPSCLICDCPLTSGVVNVGEKGQKKLVWASSMRNDGKFHEVSENTISLHTKCRSRYTNDACVAAANKKVVRENREVCYLESLEINGVEEESVLECCIQNETENLDSAGGNSDSGYLESSAIKSAFVPNNVNSFENAEKKINSAEEGSSNHCNAFNAAEKSTSGGENHCEISTEKAAEKCYSMGENINELSFESTAINSNSAKQNSTLFDYKKHCIFCANDASDDFIQKQRNKPAKQKVLMYKVSKGHTGDNILSYCLYSETNEFSKAVRPRVENKDLVGLKARYHKVCYMKFMTMNPMKPLPGKKGRPPDVDIQNQMKLVYDYIDNHLAGDAEISIEEIRKAVNVDVHFRTMQANLGKHYGEAIDITLPNNRIKMRKNVESNLLDDSIVPETSAEEDFGQGSSRHTGYRCDLCQEDIVRFRYACVECANFDLCAACEARGEHEHHYALRVPANKQPVEVQAILENIRNVLLKKDDNNSCEPEVKIEEPEQFTEDDPLAPPDDYQFYDSEEQLPTKVPSRLSPSSNVEQNTTENATTVEIKTESIGKGCQVALYAQFKAGPQESPKASYSVHSGHGNKESQKTLYRLTSEEQSHYPQPKTALEESLVASYSRIRTERSSEVPVINLYSGLQAVPSRENTQTASCNHLKTEPIRDSQRELHRWLKTGPKTEENMNASCIDVASDTIMQPVYSYTEPCERLRVRQCETRMTKRISAGRLRASGEEKGACDRFTVNTHQETLESAPQAEDKEREQMPSGSKRKSRHRPLLCRPKMKK